MLPQIQSKKKTTAYTNDSILESLRGIGASVGKTIVKDVALQTAGDVLGSILGTAPKSGDLQPGQPLEFNAQPKTQEVAPVINRVRRPEISLEPLRQQEEAKIAQELNAVRTELKALTSAMKNLHQEIERAIDEVPVEPGVYHLNFMGRLRSMIKILREQIDDSSSWLALSTNRKKKKGYWGMYKKHGTTFGLSNERSLATQAG